jgi:signal transduction histidine kinase/ActR/RegA family two-component response regulator
VRTTKSDHAAGSGRAPPGGGVFEGRVELDEPWVMQALSDTRTGAWRLDVATMRLDWTAGLEQVFQVDEFGGGLADWLELVHPEDRERAMGALMQCIELGVDLSFEYRLANPRPSCWVGIAGSPRKGPDGAVAEIVGVAGDITERRRSQEALIAATRRLGAGHGPASVDALVQDVAALLKADYSFLAVVGKDDQVARAVACWWDGERIAPFDYALAGTPCEVVRKRRDELCLFPSRVQEKFPLDRDLVDLGVQAYAGTPITGADGSLAGILVAMWKHPVATQPIVNAVLGVLAARAGALLERLALEREQQARERRLAKQGAALAELSRSSAWASIDRNAALAEAVAITARTLDVARVGVWLFDESRNRMVVEACHADGSDSAGQRAIVLERETAPRYFAALETERVVAAEDALADPRTAELADSLLLPSGIRSLVDAPVRVEGKLVGVICCGHGGGPRTWTEDELAFVASIGDFVALAFLLAERRELELRLQHSQRMESVGRLAGGLAHDFNNLLTAIEAGAELARKPRADGSIDPVLLDEISDATTRASQLTRQLLTFARRNRVAVKRFDLNEVVDGAQRMLRRLIGEDVTLELCLASEPLAVEADQGQIEQVLVNLVVNARDAMPAGGRLVIETASIELGEEQAPGESAGTYATMVVRDTGTGMTDEVLAHVFEPFFTTKAAGEGGGLGLSTCYGIARQAGGSLTAESVFGEGATFRMTLPTVANGTFERVPSSAPEEVKEGDEVVLLVEDDIVVRKAVARGLRRYGYTVHIADGLAAAVARAEGDEAERIAIVVTDVVMPEGSGLDVADAMRRILPGVPVLFMSGYTDHHTTDKLAEMGALLLSKPFTIAALASHIRRLVAETA